MGETSQQLELSWIDHVYDFNRLISAMSIDGIWQNNLICIFEIIGVRYEFYMFPSYEMFALERAFPFRDEVPAPGCRETQNGVGDRIA